MSRDVSWRGFTPATSWIGALLGVLLCACGDGDGGDLDRLAGPEVAGRLTVSTAGQPRIVAIDENEPADDSAYAQYLGPLTPGLTYRVAGAVQAPGDIDIFWITEPSAQAVTVTLEHGGGVDFDIAVFDILSDGTLQEIGSSTGVTSPDRVSYTTPPPSPGEDFVTAVAVLGFSGTGAYDLTVEARFLEGPAAAGSGSRTPARASAPSALAARLWAPGGFDAVPGQVLVRFRDSPRLARAASPPNLGSLQACAELPGVGALYCLDAGTGPLPGPARTLSRAAALRRTLGLVLRARAHPQVADAIPNYRLQPSRVPNDEFYPLQWHYPMIGLPEAWNTTTGSPEVLVAVLDTGILADHPDLAGRVEGGYDFVSDVSAAADGDGPDADPTDPGDSAVAGQSSWHGTHVAGTVAAASDNGRGVAGVAWNAVVMPVRVLGRGGGSLADVLDGMRFAAGLSNSAGARPLRRAHIINMSLGGADPNGDAVRFLQPTITEVRAQGVLVVAAAGNENSAVPAAPAAADGVLSVSAVDAIRRRAPYSNFGSTVDLAAPGGSLAVDRNGDGRPDGVLSTLRLEGEQGYGYTFYQGTSMASPHVAGVAALCLAARPDLGVAELEDVLLSTATDLGAPGRDDLYGHGLVNAAAALLRATQGPEDPVLGLFPNLLSFGADADRLETAVTNTGAGSLTITAIGVSTSDGNPWLAAELRADGRAVVVSVERSGLPAGRYAGRVQVDSSGGTRSVAVDMEVVLDQRLPEVGTVYVLLVEPSSSVTVAQATTDRSRDYTFALRDVPDGAYYLVAGTDDDDDGFICGAREFCGAYPVENQPEIIAVEPGRPVAGLDFTLSYTGVGLNRSAPRGDGPPRPAGWARRPPSP